MKEIELDISWNFVITIINEANWGKISFYNFIFISTIIAMIDHKNLLFESNKL